MSAPTVELELAVHYETEDAILVSSDGEEEHTCWLPLSEVSDIVYKRRAPIGRAKICTMYVPEWLAHKKGLV